MTTLIEQLAFSASITGPICLMLFLGVLLKRIRLINENFIDIASKLVFQVTLPAMLFLSIVQAEHDFSKSGNLVFFGLVVNALFFLFTMLVTKRVFREPKDQGVIIQGGFRANTAIIGLAYVANIYGESGVALAAIYVASTTVLYNIQAVIALSPTEQGFGAQAVKVIGKTLTRNPLIISILLGVIAYSLSIPIPNVAIDAGQYFADMTLPLALLCTGGSLNIQSLKHDRAPTWFASCFKLILAPVTATLAAVAFGYHGQELGLIFLMTAAPTAAASYVMARAMGGNATLAANIIALTTVLSLITCTLGIFTLSALKLI
ncbi:AEC family transporter [Vibrio genomosp. F10 str. 9ZC157]|uniref:AEC family transporter n=1 Tax=Vibrio genomosp. F10 TaxID=723171 RepID=UPI0002EDD800|nr:AEC family transporter [Vibrio genomosp. F10]OEE93706.1 transporter [Vibrio genomosp. F10 str. 9ZC157]